MMSLPSATSSALFLNPIQLLDYIRFIAAEMAGGRYPYVRYDEAADGGQLVERVRQAGDGVGFGPHYVHDMRNLSDRPAVSVHAYSAPLTCMTYYDIDPDGGLSRLLTVATDDPEPAVRVPGLGTPAA
jgi:Cysteine dioxygenase type I